MTSFKQPDIGTTITYDGNLISFRKNDIRMSSLGTTIGASGAQLLENLRGARKEYNVIIEKLFERIKSTARNEGYEI